MLVKDPTTQHIVSFDKIKLYAKNNLEIKYEIIFTHNTIRDGKAVEKQKNYKDKLYGKFNEKG